MIARPIGTLGLGDVKAGLDQLVRLLQRHHGDDPLSVADVRLQLVSGDGQLASLEPALENIDDVLHNAVVVFKVERVEDDKKEGEQRHQRVVQVHAVLQ